MFYANRAFAFILRHILSFLATGSIGYISEPLGAILSAMITGKCSWSQYKIVFFFFDCTEIFRTQFVLCEFSFCSINRCVGTSHFDGYHKYTTRYWLVHDVLRNFIVRNFYRKHFAWFRSRSVYFEIFFSENLILFEKKILFENFLLFEIFVLFENLILFENSLLIKNVIPF